jgi:hypothetical protein
MLNERSGNGHRLLPRTNVELLRIAVIGMVLGCAWCNVQYFRSSIVVGAVSLVLWVPLAVGLWRLLRWARLLALLILYLFVFTSFYNVSSFAVSDSAAPPLPIWQQLVELVAPVAIPSVFFIEMLHAYKDEFRWLSDSWVKADRSTPQLLPPRSWLMWCLAVFGVPVITVALLNLDIRLLGGCIPFAASVSGEQERAVDLWHIPPLAGVTVGLLVFLLAAPKDVSNINRMIRALVYAAGMLWFYACVSSYLGRTSLC